MAQLSMNSNTARNVIEDRALQVILNGVIRPVVALEPINMDNEEHVELLRAFMRDFPGSEPQPFLENLLAAVDPNDHRVFVTELLRAQQRTLAVLSLEFSEGDVQLRFIPTNGWTNSERKASLDLLAIHLEDLALKQGWKRILLKEPSRLGISALQEVLSAELSNGTLVEECN